MCLNSRTSMIGPPGHWVLGMGGMHLLHHLEMVTRWVVPWLTKVRHMCCWPLPRPAFSLGFSFLPQVWFIYSMLKTSSGSLSFQLNPETPRHSTNNIFNFTWCVDSGIGSNVEPILSYGVHFLLSSSSVVLQITSKLIALILSYPQRWTTDILL